MSNTDVPVSCGKTDEVQCHELREQASVVIADFIRKFTEMLMAFMDDIVFTKNGRPMRCIEYGVVMMSVSVDMIKVDADLISKLNPRSEPCESKLPEMTKFALISRMGKVSEFMKSSPTPSQSTNAAEKLKLDECRLAMVKFIVQLLQLRDAELSNAISDEGILNTIEEITKEFWQDQVLQKYSHMISEVVQGKPIEVTGKPDLLEVSENLDNTRRHHDAPLPNPPLQDEPQV